MTQVALRDISKTFGPVRAVDGVSLDIESGEFVCLLGASGCGKTTLLRILGGFTRPDMGEVLVNGKRVDMLPPNRREVGFVFQSYALFPTKTVAENIGFGLAVRRRPKTEIAARVAELSELVRLNGMEQRYPHELSGGQQQRVALARALATRPAMLLLDEPLSALDAKIRAHLRGEIRAIVDRLGITTVYVTHDQEEALSIADRVAVMDAGRLLQIDSPMDIYLRPRERFVADFVGTSNALAARPVDGRRVQLADLTMDVPVPDGLAAASSITVCIRPENVVVRPAGSGGGAGRLHSVTFSGAMVRAVVATAEGRELVADVPTHEWRRLALRRGDAIAWTVRPDSLILLPGDQG
ncbi:MAG: ABC transporter ATP-binding protein [Alphaproteobacteria bacterium]|nr:ABC transporter ATP-binding protein [Alphaproteobacteria bacterium]